MRRDRAFSLCPFAQNFGILFEIRTNVETFGVFMESATPCNVEPF
ncbi:hypothetical protein J2X19_002534 [Rhodoferax ferrireducens]|uniref:Uncharacterized protein n=1 Tax=Rhodoferax ferrireducens TaxID=192843 RepID=A0ABU2C935_9BURK|nr:hypothetical protein [Rhodoferax ferrireducens]